MLAVLERQYDRVTHVGDEENRQYYEIEHHGLRFHTVLVHVEDNPDKITDFAFICYFVGFDVTDSGIEALNRNLHLSVAELDDRDGLLLFASLRVKGAYDENLFSLVLEAWQRDLVMTIKMLVPGASISAALPEQARMMMRRRANDLGATATSPMSDRVDAHLHDGSHADIDGDPSRHPTRSHSSKNLGPEADAFRNRQSPEAIASFFLGVRDASRTLCESCGGKGRVGFPKRRCDPCRGSGLSAPTTR